MKGSRPLQQQITHALTVLRDARQVGDVATIEVASARLDRLIDRFSEKYLKDDDGELQGSG